MRACKVSTKTSLPASFDRILLNLCLTIEQDRVYILHARGEHTKQKDPYMFEIISQLEKIADAYDDVARDDGQMLFEKTETVEWRAAQLLRIINEANNNLMDAAKFTDNGVLISYRHYAEFLEILNMMNHSERLERLNYGE